MGSELSKQCQEGGEPPAFLNDILIHLKWIERGNINQLTKSYRERSLQKYYYRWLCERLSYEHNIYISLVIPYQNNWKILFFELWGLRKLWEAANNNDLQLSSSSSSLSSSSSERFKINVYARFKPKSINDNILTNESIDRDNNKENDEKEITLPLHQRLAMIKMSHNLTSNKEALKVLAYEGGWFQKKWNSIEEDNKQKSDENETLKSTFSKNQKFIPIICNNMEKHEKFVAKVQSVDEKSGRIVMIAPDVGLREFCFDSVLSDKSNQNDSYEIVARRLVMDFINGYNGTILAYGQTGSGKSYTMFGPDSESIYGSNISKRGIIPRACQEILNAMGQRKKNITSTLSVSYVEVYGDSVSDLLRTGARVGHNKAASQRWVLSGAAEKNVTSIDDVLNALALGEQQKRRAATAMNDRSTRAHSIFIITLRQECNSTGASRSSKLFLADLGGSEQVKKSKVEAGESKVKDEFSLGFQMADRMREAVYINLGLLALKKCIEALNNRSLYVPFQDSKLTMLLSQGLGGDSKTSVIVCNSMESSNANETMATLRFGERCSLIENEAKNHATMLAGVLADLQAQIKSVEELIKIKEKWVLQDLVRDDTLAEENTLEAAVGAKEIVKVSVLVGAEKERKELESLLRKLAEFTGTKPLDEAKKTVGFGRKYSVLYGLGSEYNPENEEDTENNRFKHNIGTEELSAVVRAKGAKIWGNNTVTDPKELEKLAKKTNRSRSVYSGISA